MLDTLNNINIDDNVRVVNIDNRCGIKRRLMRPAALYNMLFIKRQ